MVRPTMASIIDWCPDGAPIASRGAPSVSRRCPIALRSEVGQMFGKQQGASNSIDPPPSHASSAPPYIAVLAFLTVRIDSAQPAVPHMDTIGGGMTECGSYSAASGIGGSMKDCGTQTRDCVEFSEQEPFGNSYPYQRLILTDLEQQPAPTSRLGQARVDEAGELDPPVPWTEQAQKMYDVTNQNVKLLRGSGATGPFFNVSGFHSNKGGNKFLPFDEFAKAWQYKLGLVFWGSPHWGETKNDEMTQRWRDSAQFKTNAWESMSWLAGSACIMMTFHECYKVEFWSPNYHQGYSKGGPDTREKRQLVVAPAYFRNYTPIGSGNEYSEMHSKLQVMIALLVPARFKDLITYYDGIHVDVGMTMLRIYRQLHSRDEYALELGGQTFALSMELHLAREAQLASHKPEYRRSMEVDERSGMEVDA
eukprot:3182378-Pyramimonas_sp.AAC.2